MADQISTFSSWGLGPELEIKPDVGAPGGYIYSSIPVRALGISSSFVCLIQLQMTMILILFLLFL